MGGCSLLSFSPPLFAPLLLSFSLFLSRAYTHTHTYTCTYENACLSYLPFRSLFFSFLRSRAQSRTSAVSPLPTIKDHDRPLRFKFLSGWTGEESLRPGNGNLSAGRGETHRLAALTVYAVLSVIVVFPSIPFFRVFLASGRSERTFSIEHRVEQEERILSIIAWRGETIVVFRNFRMLSCIAIRFRLERVRSRGDTTFNSQ